MKKILLTMTAILAVGFANAQIYAASDSAAFADWTPYDNDGDGNDWAPVVINNPAITAPGFNGAEGYLSNSYLGSALTPDNLGLSPVIDCSANSTVFLNWTCGSPETTASGWYEEHYAMYVIRASDLPAIILGNYPAPVFETTLTAGETFFNESVDVSSIAGGQSDVHIILRHFDCTDENWILFTNVELSGTASLGADLEASNGLTVYPNPADKEINLDFGGLEGTASVSIISVDGAVVAQQEVNDVFEKTVTFETANLNNGVYILQIINNGNVSTERIVISK